MPADVIEVDFRSTPLDPLDEVDEILDELGALAKGIGDAGRLAADASRRAAWVENQWLLERRSNARLRRALLHERARSYPFSDVDVLRAVRKLYAGQAITATEIGVELYGHKPTHSNRIRVGLALSRLAAAGHVHAERRRADDRSSARDWTIDDA